MKISLIVDPYYHHSSFRKNDFSFLFLPSIIRILFTSLNYYDYNYKLIYTKLIVNFFLFLEKFVYNCDDDDEVYSL